MTFIQFSGYVVEKRSRGGDWVPVNNFPVKDTKFTVMGLQEGTVVEFRVAAVNDGGPGKFSKATPPHQVRDQVCKQIGHLLTHLWKVLVKIKYPFLSYTVSEYRVLFITIEVKYIQIQKKE